MSGVYLTNDCLKLEQDKPVSITSVFEGKVTAANWPNDLSEITLLELKTTALTVFGIPANELRIEINDENVNRVLFHNINSYWHKWINRHSPFSYRYIILLIFPWATEWSVLGVARQLYTVKTGQITSKLAVGYYALGILPEKYHPILREAINIRKTCKQLTIKLSVKRARQTIECVNFIIDSFNYIYKAGNDGM